MAVVLDDGLFFRVELLQDDFEARVLHGSSEVSLCLGYLGLCVRSQIQDFLWEGHILLAVALVEPLDLVVGLRRVELGKKLPCAVQPGGLDPVASRVILILGFHFLEADDNGCR